MTAPTYPLKRPLDVCLSLFLLLVLSPLLALVALFVLASMGRPVFFRHWRVGLKGRPFRIWKFRSMVVDAERAGPVVSISDPRITRVGRLLRLTSLDELPQLLNVIAGDMSFVGPRALTTESIRPEESWRLAVKPGVTSLPIVRGRQSLDWDRRMALDAWYVENCTLLLDFRILLETIAVVVLRKNVYDKDGEMKERFP